MAEVPENKRRVQPAQIQVPDGGVRVLESLHAEGFYMETGRWPFHKLCWVVEGEGFVEISGTSEPIGRRNFLLLPAHLPHRFVDDPKNPLMLSIVCVSEFFPMNEELWEKALEREGLGTPRTARTAFHYQALVNCFRQSLREQEQEQTGWEAALACAANELLIMLARGYGVVRETDAPDRAQAIEGVVDFLNGNFHEPQRIDEMAERCGMSPRRFTELFKARTGQTFSHYLNELRINFAKERLQQTGHILYACHESGFNDLAYFYRVFKKHTGQTPGDYLG